VFDLHAGLVEEGHSVTTVCPGAPGAAPEEDGEAGRVLRVDYATREEQDLFYGDGLESNWRSVRRRWRKLRGWMKGAGAALASEASAADTLIGHWLWPGGRLAVSAGGDRPVLAVAHGGDIHLLGRTLGGRLLARGLKDRLRGVLATSSSGAALVSRRLGLAADRLVVRAMGVDPEPFRSPPPPPPEWPRGYLLGVGRLVRLKGFDLLVEGAARLGRPLVLIGEGPERSDLQERAAAAGVQTLFTGAVSRSLVASAMGSAAAVVVPSRAMHDGRVEGCPVVAVEALVAGATLVASRTGGLPDLLPPELLFAPDDPVALADAVVRALGAPSAPAAPYGLGRRDAARDLLGLL
jgi:glycosyltransferase involved in cell wall biosynthesis